MLPRFLDIDFRADQWFDPRAFGVTLRASLPSFNIVVGTEEEILATFLTDKEQLLIKHQQISAPEIRGISKMQSAKSCGLVWKRLWLNAGKTVHPFFSRRKMRLKFPDFRLRY